MNSEKRLTTLFKSFMERTCLNFIRMQESLLKEWLYFSTLISQDFIDYQRLEKYVESLGQPSIQMSSSALRSLDTQIPNIPNLSQGFLKKKQQIIDRFKQQGPASSLRLTRTAANDLSPCTRNVSTIVADFSRTSPPPPQRKSERKIRRNHLAQRLRTLQQLFEDNDNRFSKETYYRRPV